MKVKHPTPLHPVARQHHPNSTHHDLHSTVHLECALLRVSFNGRTLASQANNVGSIPITRSIFQIKVVVNQHLFT